MFGNYFDMSSCIFKNLTRTYYQLGGVKLEWHILCECQRCNVKDEPLYDDENANGAVVIASCVEAGLPNCFLL